MKVLKDLARSKKFLTAFATMLVVATNKVGLDMPPEAITLFVSMAASYILAQGLADHGKERAKHEYQ